MGRTQILLEFVSEIKKWSSILHLRSPHIHNKDCFEKWIVEGGLLLITDMFLCDKIIPVDLYNNLVIVIDESYVVLRNGKLLII